MKMSQLHKCGYFLALACLAGCAGGKNYRLGREAERRGDVHQAYDYYCKAAKESPGDSAIATSVERLAPTAATYWHSQARIAWSEKRYADAWQMTIRCLEIRPDHSGAIEFIDKLEGEHPSAVASARQDWLRRGSQSLTVAKRDGVQVASGRPGMTNPRPQLKAKPKINTSKSASKSRNNKAKAAKPQKTLKKERIAKADKPRSPTLSRGPAPQRREERPKSVQAESVKGSERPPGDGEYLVIRTLSKRDKRFKRRAKAVDGIAIKLKDTEEEQDVDLDLYQGDRRVQKIRNLKMGRSKIFRGRSGKWYRLTVLKVHHKSHTVRIGIKSA